MESNKSINELISELYALFSSFKEKLESPNYSQIETTLQQLTENQNEIKNDLSELKKTLLNPYDGLIVESKFNTKHRYEMEEWLKDYETILEQHKELQRWKTAVTRIAIALFTASGGVVSFLLSKYLEM